MKAHEFTRPENAEKKFRLQKGKLVYDHAYMNGDRKRVCITRTEAGVVTKRYIKPHTLVVEVL